MAEGGLFSLTSRLLAVIDSSLIRWASKRRLLIPDQGVRQDLDKLKQIIYVIQPKIPLFTKAAKDWRGRYWIRDLESVLYDAEDLLDEMAATEALLLKKSQVGTLTALYYPTQEEKEREIRDILSCKKRMEEESRTFITTHAEERKEVEDILSGKKRMKGVRYISKSEEEILSICSELSGSSRAYDRRACEIIEEAGHLSSTSFKFHSIISDTRIRRKIRDVRKRLKVICLRNDSLIFQPTTSSDIQWSAWNQIQMITWSTSSSALVSRVNVVGRNDDKKAVVRFLVDKTDADQSGVPVIAIVGEDGIGKTTLAQLVYNDEQVVTNFKRRWWASICGVYDEKKILARILRCIRTTSMNEQIHGLSISDLYAAIKESMNSHGKYLLVLDGVPCAGLAGDAGYLTCFFYSKIMPFLRSGEIESRIIITTRDAPSGADYQILRLIGLTKEETWQLFNLTASLPPENDDTPTRIDLGRTILPNADGVPLAIKIIARQISTIDQIHELPFAYFNNRPFINLIARQRPSINLIATQSYIQLPSVLKPCLAYCSFFPEDYVFQTDELIYLWIAQGFVMPLSDGKSVEEMGYEYFKELYNRFFFQEATVNEYGKVVSCKMHVQIHRFVQSMAGGESCILTEQNDKICYQFRYVNVGYAMDGTWIIPPWFYMIPQPPLRSFLSFCGGSISPLVLDELLIKFKLLRAIKLRHQEIKVVPHCIGKLKCLRYLNLSHNQFSYLPESIVMLVNLLTLDISWCEQLELLPVEFRKLYNLRHLDTENCCRLRHMPPGFEELTNLQHLSLFKVGKPMNDARYSRIDALSGLQLRGKLEVKFDEDTVWDKNDPLELPIGITLLTITNYLGMRLLPSMLSNLVSLHIGPSSKIKQISLLRGLPSLETLQLSYLEQLEYIETEEAETSAPFFFSLKVLTLEGLPKLMGWSREVEAALTCQESVIRHISCTSFPQLSELTVRCCRQLKFMPPCPKLQTLELNGVNHMLITNLLLSTTFHAFFPLETTAIWDCDLQTFPGGNLTFLRQLDLRYCYKLEDLQLPPRGLNSLEQLVIHSCPKLELWEEKKKKKKKGVDWDSLPKLCELTLIGMPNPDQLPDWLQQRQALGKVHSIEQNKERNIFEVRFKYSAGTGKRDNILGMPSKYSPEIEAEPEKRDKMFDVPLKLNETEKYARSKHSLGAPPERKKFNLAQQIKRLPFKHFKKRPSTSQADPEQYQTHQP